MPKNRSGGFAPLTPHRGLCPLDPCWGSAPDPVGLRRLRAAAPRPLRCTSPSLKVPPLQSPWISPRPCSPPTEKIFCARAAINSKNVENLLAFLELAIDKTAVV